MLQVQQILEALGRLAPWDLAENWDRVGLQVGQTKQKVNRIMVALDLNQPVWEEALRQKVDGLIVHHPLIFKPLTQINSEEPLGQRLGDLLKHNLFLIVAHTNLDKAESGLSQHLADSLGLTQIESLEVEASSLCKLVVFVPEAQVEQVRQAMVEAGAGEIGAYTDCSFSSKGQGTFKPGQSANPVVGHPGQLEKVEELRVEMIARQTNLPRILAAIAQAHPYQEPAIDIYPLLNPNRQGLGRIGVLKPALSFGKLCELVKTKLDVAYLRVAGDPKVKIERLAVVSGSGGDLIGAALAKRADAYLSGDLDYHDFRLAQDYGLPVIDAGHWGTEHGFADLISAYLRDTFNDTGLEVITSNASQAESTLF